MPGLLAEPTEAEVRAREHERAEADVEALLGIWGQQVNIALGRVTVSPASYREATRAAARAAIRELGVEIVADGLRFLSESEHERAEFHRENAANGTDKYLTLRWALSDLARLAEFASWQRRPPAPATRDPRYLSDTELGKAEAWANAYRQPPLEPEEPR